MLFSSYKNRIRYRQQTTRPSLQVYKNSYTFSRTGAWIIEIGGLAVKVPERERERERVIKLLRWPRKLAIIFIILISFSSRKFVIRLIFKIYQSIDYRCKNTKKHLTHTSFIRFFFWFEYKKSQIVAILNPKCGG